jgi:hypothetical protein
MYIVPPYPFNEQECNLDDKVWSVPRLAMLARDLPLLSLPLDALNLANTVYECNMREMVRHYNTINDADLEQPILLSEDGEIFDGRHRIMKALSQGLTHINAKRFDINPSPCRYNTK